MYCSYVFKHVREREKPGLGTGAVGFGGVVDFPKNPPRKPLEDTSRNLTFEDLHGLNTKAGVLGDGPASEHTVPKHSENAIRRYNA